MTCISSLTNIAKQRSNYTTTVLQTFELLHGEAASLLSLSLSLSLSLFYQLSPRTANLPAHFATSQISSVRKQLKVSVQFAECIWLLCHSL